MDDIRLVKPTEFHIRYVADNCRWDETAEAKALGLDLHAAINESVERAEECWAVVDQNDFPCCIFGVGRTPTVQGARVWMVATPAVYQCKKLLVLMPRLYLGQWLKTYGRLENFCLSTNTRSIRWLQRLGFQMQAFGYWTHFYLTE